MRNLLRGPSALSRVLPGILTYWRVGSGSRVRRVTDGALLAAVPARDDSS